MKRIILLGATGSIGKQTLEIIEQNTNEFELVGISYGKNIEFAREIMKKFDTIKYVASLRQEDNETLSSQFPNVEFLSKEKGLCDLAEKNDYDILVTAIVGNAGLKPTVSA